MWYVIKKKLQNKIFPASSKKICSKKMNESKIVGNRIGNPNCLQCQLSESASIAKQDTFVFVVEHPNPKSSFHYIVIPYNHVTLSDDTNSILNILTHMFSVQQQIVPENIDSFDVKSGLSCCSSLTNEHLQLHIIYKKDISCCTSCYYSCCFSELEDVWRKLGGTGVFPSPSVSQSVFQQRNSATFQKPIDISMEK